MAENQKIDPFDLLKKGGFLLEQQLNQLIQNGLNKEEVLQRLNTAAQPLAIIIKALQEYVEWMSVPLNIPTKNDVANLAKLLIQMEEKLDALEERLTGQVRTSDPSQRATDETEVAEADEASNQENDTITARILSLHEKQLQMLQSVCKDMRTEMLNLGELSKEVNIVRTLMRLHQAVNPLNYKVTITRKQNGTETGE